MNHPVSLTQKRAKEILPKMSNARKPVMVWPEVTKEEAEYITHLDLIFTYSEVASMLTGRSDFITGMQLVAVAERALHV